MFDSATATFAANKVMRELGESGSIGKAVTHKPSFIIPAEEDFVPDVTLSDMRIKWFSAEVPTKDEFMSGKVFASKSGVTYEDDCSNYEVFAEVEKSFAISTGQLIVMVAGELENALGAVPKTGMYYCIPDYSQLSNGSIGAEFTFVWETIHPIDPKYLPGVVMPVVEIETEPNGDGVELSDADMEKLKALNGAVPFVAKFSMEGLPVYAVMNGINTIYEGQLALMASGSFRPAPTFELVAGFYISNGSGVVYAYQKSGL